MYWGLIGLPEGVADGLKPLGWDGDDHVDGGRPDHALGRVEEVRIGQAVPKQKNNRIYLPTHEFVENRARGFRMYVEIVRARKSLNEPFFASHSGAFDFKY